MSLPNLRMPTAGGHIFWSTLESRNGFKLQENKVTGHFRVLDPANYRFDWGVNESQLRDTFNTVAKY